MLALDVGDRRIGVAAGDPTGTLASPLTTIERRAECSDVEAVLRLADEHEAAAIVVGMPLSLSGGKSSQTRKVEGFTRSLARQSPVPVTSIDERLSSAQAERLIRASGKSPSREKPLVDAAAAAVILQAYLDSGTNTSASRFVENHPERPEPTRRRGRRRKGRRAAPANRAGGSGS